VRRSLVAASLALAACGPAVDPTKLAAVQVVGTEGALRGCRLLGPLVGKDEDRWTPGSPRYETAVQDLRRKAVLGGGNRLVTDSIEPPRDGDPVPAFVVRARLFACAGSDGGPSEGPPTPPGSAGAIVSSPTRATAEVTPAAKPTARLSCEPDCSPGYTCIRGTCVSACNPVCGGGERCGTDRICHPLAAVAPAAPVPP
jgi:hypothetical protein